MNSLKAIRKMNSYKLAPGDLPVVTPEIDHDYPELLTSACIARDINTLYISTEVSEEMFKAFKNEYRVGALTSITIVLNNRINNDYEVRRLYLKK
jgi:hypothetical protein